MFAIQYSHRLPANYNMQQIRDRATTLGPKWDAIEGMIFKAFIAQERGVNGAAGNLYGAVYLWQDADATARFLMGERFQGVIDSFGRPQVENWLPLDARIGPAQKALSLYREESPIDAAADRTALLVAEQERNRRIAAQPDSVAVWTVLDVNAWRLIRFRMSSQAPDVAKGAAVYEILYLAKPGLSRLS
ncbi:hypothetical protein CAter282_2199 [Collimonas arenae]|uniref:DUF4865 domain-containing protein n=1 Tax=Collimonas arenae TaxID=279058 RepID=A0A127QIT7_9BURK|nr:DUF4865 family protein [Collimonas arenae]AMP00058.1 hypothetical protein CAter10_2398 [Collimonas arenae]AMP09953.1 hypothetical protein CAter282_2199 [Collimonas arenae]